MVKGLLEEPHDLIPFDFVLIEYLRERASRCPHDGRTDFANVRVGYLNWRRLSLIDDIDAGRIDDEKPQTTVYPCTDDVVDVFVAEAIANHHELGASCADALRELL